MAGYRIEPFDGQDAVSAEDVMALWMRETGMPAEEARGRSDELVVVAIDPGGRPAGVSTAYLERYEQLRTELWHARVFVAAAHRGGKLAVALAQGVRDTLTQRWNDGDRRGAGVLFEVQHAGLKTLDLAVWRRTGFTFVGETPFGDPVRVVWFPGAEAPEPVA